MHTFTLLFCFPLNGAEGIRLIFFNGDLSISNRLKGKHKKSEKYQLIKGE